MEKNKYTDINIKSEVDKKLTPLLAHVEKPSRYTGGEYNQIIKNKNDVHTRVALCFPDVYEIGMSNLGIKILYGVMNNIDGVWCERVFSPWPDMEEQLRLNNIPLYALESFDPIQEFDIIAFSLGYELSYTNVLNMLDLAGVKWGATERGLNDPVIIAGGTCCFNPEPMSDFIDLFVIGEGEEVITEILELYKENRNKTDFFRKAADIEGVYVPYRGDTENQQKSTVKKRIVKDLNNAYYPLNPVIPSMGIVHDRAVIELFRGCRRGCKFCQAGHIYNPIRERSAETLLIHGKESITNSGYDEIALLSLSTSDYRHLEELCDGLLKWCTPRHVNLSLPSLRADNFSVSLMERVQKVRKSGLTFAPEAGSQRLRDYINKNISEEDLLSACRAAFTGGWNTVKLYFMLGLPTETDEDIVAIAALGHKVIETWKSSSANKKRGVRINISTSYFIPKPHTPFERETMISVNEYLRRVNLLKDNIKSKQITYSWHTPEQCYIEAALSRGDRKIAKVIETARLKGARFDSWSEHFSAAIWNEAFEECSMSADCYNVRQRDTDEELPWSFIVC